MAELDIHIDGELANDTPNLRHPGIKNLTEGATIYLAGLLAWRIWIYMAFSEIRRRYNRTMLGPFWVTLSVAIFITSVSIIFPILWHTDPKIYVPFFSSGFIIWSFLSSLASEGCGTYIDFSSLIKQIVLPYAVYSNVVVMRNLVVVLHHLTVYLVVMVVFSVPIGFNTLLIIPGMLLICLTGSWLCILLGILTTRYRDIRQTVTSLIQIAMFLTPIFWQPSALGSSRKAFLIIALNPLYHFIQIARAPLSNQQPTLLDWEVTIAVCLLGWLFTLAILGKYKKHIVFWL